MNDTEAGFKIKRKQIGSPNASSYRNTSEVVQDQYHSPYSAPTQQEPLDDDYPYPDFSTDYFGPQHVEASAPTLYKTQAIDQAIDQEQYQEPRNTQPGPGASPLPQQEGHGFTQVFDTTYNPPIYNEVGAQYQSPQAQQPPSSNKPSSRQYADTHPQTPGTQPQAPTVVGVASLRQASTPIFQASDIELGFVFGRHGLAAWYCPSSLLSNSGTNPQQHVPPWNASLLLNRALHISYIGHFRPAFSQILTMASSPHAYIFIAYGDPTGIPGFVFYEPLWPVLKTKRRLEEQQRSDSYSPLRDWLIINIDPKDEHSLRNTVIAFGAPRYSYYAQLPNGRTISRDLPESLTTLLAEKRNQQTLPSYMSLGVNNSWTITWPDGSVQYEITRSDYEDLFLVLEDPRTPTLNKIILSPVAQNEFALRFTTGQWFLRTRFTEECSLEALNETLLKLVERTTLPNNQDPTSPSAIPTSSSPMPTSPSAIPTPPPPITPIVSIYGFFKYVGRDKPAPGALYLLPEKGFKATTHAKHGRPGELPKWMEATRMGINVAQNVAQVLSQSGACAVM